MSEPLPELLRILGSARVDGACVRFHVTDRVLPPLKALARRTDDPQLRMAASHATSAVEHVEAMMEDLRTAITLIETAAPTEDRQTA